MRDYYTEIRSILGSGGAAYCLVPFGDPAYENAAKTTVTSLGAGAGDGLVFTYQPVSRPGWRHQIVGRRRLCHLGFDGSTNYLSTPDADFWSLGNSLADVDCSFGWWLHPMTTVDANRQAGKWNDNGAANSDEYNFESDSDKLITWAVQQETVIGDPTPNIKTSLPLVLGQTQYMSLTYAGASAVGATAMNNANWYRNGVLDGAPTRTNVASYVAMDNLTQSFGIGNGNGASAFRVFSGYMLGGPLGFYLTKRVLSAVDQADIYKLGQQLLSERFSANYRRMLHI